MIPGWIFRLIGICIFIIVLANIGLSDLWQILTNSDISLILLIILLQVILVFSLRIARWKILLSSQNIKLKITEAAMLFMSAFYLSTITPGRIGDLARIYFIRKKGYSLGKSALSVVIDRLQDIAFLLIVGVFSLLVFSSFFLGELIVIISAAVLLIAVLALIFLSPGFRKLLMKSILTFIPKKFKESFRGSISELLSDLKKISFFTWLITTILTILAWFLFFTSIFFIANALFIEIQFIYIIIGLSISALLALLPVSFSGIGTRDAVFILIFNELSLSSESAVALSAMVLASYLIAAIIGLISWLLRPIRSPDGS